MIVIAGVIASVIRCVASVACSSYISAILLRESLSIPLSSPTLIIDTKSGSKAFGYLEREILIGVPILTSSITWLRQSDINLLPTTSLESSSAKRMFTPEEVSVAIIFANLVSWLSLKTSPIIGILSWNVDHHIQNE